MSVPGSEGINYGVYTCASGENFIIVKGPWTFSHTALISHWRPHSTALAVIGQVTEGCMTVGSSPPTCGSFPWLR